jgi:hypothetical protein
MYKLERVAEMLIPPKSCGSRSILTATAARLVSCHPATVRRAIEREGDDPPLDERGELVRHTRLAPLAGTQDLQAVALDAPLPHVVRGTVDTEDAARFRDADTPGEVHEL